MTKPTFYEFFAGGGMARAGLGEGWRCLFANDFDAKKVETYKANWGDKEIRLGDIHKLTPADLPGQADLAWASFPCQDLSLAGNGKGLQGERSGAFWGFHDIVHALKMERRAPKLLVLENVVGTLTANKGDDFRAICRALDTLGYRFGALVIDAVHFLPQSRPRLFIVAQRKDLPLDLALVADGPVEPWTSKALTVAADRLPRDLRAQWIWWNLASPPMRNAGFSDLIEMAPREARWRDDDEMRALLAMMSPVNRRKVEDAKKAGRRMVGALYRRTRLDESGRKVQRIEVRFDDVAGCLRTPAGGSSRQSIMIVEGDEIAVRLLTARETARLMGLDDSYALPGNYNEAYHLTGDGVAVPVVRHLAERFLGSALLAGRFLAAAE